MLNLPTSTRVYLAAEPVDIRKGFDALAGWVEANGLDVYSGHLFVFLSRRRPHVVASRQFPPRPSDTRLPVRESGAPLIVR